MDIHSLVNSKLHEIHRSRSRFGLIPSILFILASTFFQRRLLVEDSLWMIVLSVVALGLLIRALLAGPLFQVWARGDKSAYLLNGVGFAIFGLGWGLHFWDVYTHYGPASSNASYALLIVMGFVTSTSSTLGADKTSYYTFVTTVSLACLLTYMTNPMNQGFAMVFIVLYYGFCIGNYRVTHKQLRSLIEAQIKSEEERDRLIKVINSVPGYVSFWDRNLTCYMANDAAAGAVPDLVGRGLGGIDPDSDWESIVMDFFASGKKSEVKASHTFITGSEMWLLLNLQRMSDGSVILVGVDTTEFVRAQKTIRDQEAKAQYTAKLVSLGEMAAGIAHEVNNPLAIIQGSAHIIEKLVDAEPLDLGTVKILSKKMVETCDRISRIIRSLKSLSRNGEKDPMIPVFIPTLIEHCLDVCGQRFHNNEIQLKLSQEDQLSVMGREVQLGQVLLNLLSNSIDAVKPLEEKWVEIKVTGTGSWVDIHVIDSGKGIPEEIQKKIMEPFFTTKEVNQGTGLGLSISKTIMRDHGGELTLLPEAPHTTFRMRLPRSA